MSRVARLAQFVRRHGTRTPSAAVMELAARAYFREPVRAGVRRLVRPRRPERWIFPVGCYNSGTTITKALLAAHPDIRALPREGVRFTAMLPAPERLGWTRMWVACEEAIVLPPRLEPARYERIVHDWAPWWRAGGLAFIDKSVSNVTRMPWLDLNFPRAYFIGIVRNGYCAAEGICRRARPVGAAARIVGERYPIEMAGRQWVAANERMAQDSARVERFRLIAYEELTQDPLRVLGELWAFLELPPPPMRRTAEGVEIAGTRFELRNMNAESFTRLRPGEIAALNPVIGGLMQKYGYPVLPAQEAP